MTDPRLTADLAAPITGECPTCHGNVTLEYIQHENRSIVGTESWTETRYRAASRPAVGEEGLREALREAALDLAREFLEVYEAQHGTWAGVHPKALLVERLALAAAEQKEDK